MLSPTGALAYSQETSYVYSIWYNDKRIGEHEFVIARSQEETRVRSEARMEFRVLFVPVYRYRHVANEYWQGGCLAELSAETDDNGTLYEVTARASPAGLSIDQGPEPKGLQTLSVDCAASFAYWDLGLLQRENLLNAQTGELAPAVLIRQGSEETGGSQADRYLLQAEGLSPIRLWYREGDQRWLKLETEREGGTLTYRFEREKQSALLAQKPGRG
jgi:hypothetical protein